MKTDILHPFIQLQFARYVLSSETVHAFTKSYDPEQETLKAYERVVSQIVQDFKTQGLTYSSNDSVILHS